MHLHGDDSNVSVLSFLASSFDFMYRFVIFTPNITAVMKRFFQVLFIAIGLAASSTLSAQTTIKKVVLQAFWWDYWNSNYPGSWANYLTELAPRLKTMGIDAVWIPPVSKGNTGQGSVGYDIFDHYDLGDKYQKGSVNTRVGTKDELLRMIAVMHANGIEVIQDIVLNHTIGAGDLNGTLGIDPASTGHDTINFRYVSFITPAVYGASDNYLSRSGRWSKNYQNFHPNTAHNCSTGVICRHLFGPDACYWEFAFGTSSNATYNPAQYNNYMRTEARNWVLWLKKQTGVDGFRWDATKHFPEWVQQDLSYNLKYNLPSWAQGGEGMFNVGEYVDFSATALDNYVNSVTTANSGADFLMGTFDFSLRAGLNSMVNGNGLNFDMSQLVGTQQGQRVAHYANTNTYVHRTVPFVNNHDTFRPQFDANGNYIGWDTGSELAPHIDPFLERMPLAYAAAFAVDGAPQVFFEDLFNIGGTGKRWTHQPGNSTDLPERSPLVKIIQLHQQLDFKSGAYKVRSTAAGGSVFFPTGSSANDLLIIERSAKAIIALNDNGASAQEAWVDTDFPAGTVLIDHAGYVSGTSVVQSNQRALISAPAVDIANGTYGFAIWGPQGTLPTYTPARITETSQEWELSDDLGDSHCRSLGQGGAIPGNSIAWRYAGKVFVDAGSNISFNLTADAGKDLTVEFEDLSGNILASFNGVGTYSNSFTASSIGWINCRVRNTSATQAGQTCYLRVNYTAPATISDVSLYPADAPTAQWTGNSSTDWYDCANWLNGIRPGKTTQVIINAATYYPTISENIEIGGMTIKTGATVNVDATGHLIIAE